MYLTLEIFKPKNETQNYTKDYVDNVNKKTI